MSDKADPSMPAPSSPDSSDTMLGQLKTFSPVFWTGGWMELIERFAYYGVRIMLPVYLLMAIGLGGPELTQMQKGSLFAVWAIVQSFVPILSGGFADRYGCKVNIAIATLFKIIGYLIMAVAIPISEMLAGMPLAEARAAGTDHVFVIIFAGAMGVAFGTAIFKPGIGGLIASQLNDKNASFGWSIFYQLVNIGGFLGPLIGGFMNEEWGPDTVFLLCAGTVALNFIPLFFFKEPARKAAAEGEEKIGPFRMLFESLRGLLEPRLFFYTISFAGFWLLTFQLFDILPNYIHDWVDSRDLASSLDSLIGNDIVPINDDGNLVEEWMILLNALMISIATFIMGYFTRKLPTLVTIIIGILLAVIAIYGLGITMNGWWILGCIGFFSLGEMMSGPGTSRYIVDIAPKGKEALYIGFGNFTVGIGQSIGAIVASFIYQNDGDKAVLARRYLTEKLNMSAEKVDALPKEDVVSTLAKMTDTDSFGVRDLLWNTYDPNFLWTIVALIGVVSLLMLVVYKKVIDAANHNPDHKFNVYGNVFVKILLVPMTFALIGATWWRMNVDISAPKGNWSDAILNNLGLSLNALFFTMMLVISFLPQIRSFLLGSTASTTE